jgi:hypothetical protein
MGEPTCGRGGGETGNGGVKARLRQRMSFKKELYMAEKDHDLKQRLSEIEDNSIFRNIPTNSVRTRLAYLNPSFHWPAARCKHFIL